MERKKIVGFLVNPKSGYGIALNRPGSDLIEDYDPAKSHSVVIARNFARHLKVPGIRLITAGGTMGEKILRDSGVEDMEVIYSPSSLPGRKDTLEFLKRLNDRRPDILLFFGGDGTAADISSVISEVIPVIGVPSGVKMHSSVFAVSPEHAVRIFSEWLSDGTEFERADVVDADEAAMMKGTNIFSLKGTLLVPASPHMILSSKREYQSTDIMGAVEYIIEKMEEGVSYIIGSGSTCKAILRELGYETPFFGVDIVRNRKLVAENAERKVLEECASKGRASLILTPIGGQGFVVGRGNRQIDDSILKNIRQDDLTVIASSEKLRDLDTIVLESEVWKEKWIRVIYDYGRFKLMKVTS